MTAADAIANAIYDLIKARGGGVTFATLEKEIAAFNGPIDYVDHDNPATLIWRGLSAPALQALRNLIKGGGIHFRRTTVENYANDGHRLSMSTTPNENGRVWRPVALFIGPPPIDEEALARRSSR
jgi:hypothetical protein